MTASTAPSSPPSQTSKATAERLRVLFYLFFPGGGIGRYTHSLLTHLQRCENLDLELACLPSYEWRDAATYPVWRGLSDIRHPVPILRKVRFLLGQCRNPQLLCRRAIDTSASIIHFSNINHLSYSFWKTALDRTGAKVVATVHDVRRAKAIISRRYETRRLRSFYRRADALFVHSGAQAMDLAAFTDVSRQRIHVVPHGPYDHGPPSASREELRSRYGLPQTRHIALAFGQIRDEKNLDLLLRAIALHCHDVHLLVAGQVAGRLHRDASAYRSLADELGIAESVTFINRHIPENEVPDLFHLCDWVALPYSRTFTSQSGVLNIATQYRRPLLLSATPTFIETIGNTNLGVLVEPDNVEALARGIQQIINRVTQANTQDFDAYLTTLGWETNVRNTIQVYRSLAGSITTP